MNPLHTQSTGNVDRSPTLEKENQFMERIWEIQGRTAAVRSQQFSDLPNGVALATIRRLSNKQSNQRHLKDFYQHSSRFSRANIVAVSPTQVELPSGKVKQLSRIDTISRSVPKSSEKRSSITNHFNTEREKHLPKESSFSSLDVETQEKWIQEAEEKHKEVLSRVNAKMKTRMTITLAQELYRQHIRNVSSQSENEESKTTSDKQEPTGSKLQRDGKKTKTIKDTEMRLQRKYKRKEQESRASEREKRVKEILQKYASQIEEASSEDENAPVSDTIRKSSSSSSTSDLSLALASFSETTNTKEEKPLSVHTMRLERNYRQNNSQKSEMDKNLSVQEKRRERMKKSKERMEAILERVQKAENSPTTSPLERAKTTLHRDIATKRASFTSISEKSLLRRNSTNK